MRAKRALGTAVITMGLALGAAASGCGGGSATTTGAGGGTTQGTGGMAGTGGGMTVTTSSKAADLRTSLNLLLGEHQILAAKATGAALDGRTAEYMAYADLLNQNGTDLGSVIAAAFGADAGAMFNQIWSAHDGFFVDYTTAVATMDTAKQQQAVDSLMNTYVPQFSAFISGATGLPKDTVTALTTQHVQHTKDIVDDQAAKDWVKAYADIRLAFAHVQMIADPISEAVAGKLPTMFPGDAANKGVDFRVALDKLLQEHMVLATFATGAALGGRTAEFGAAGKALNDNGTDIGTALGTLYGSDAQAMFNQIWSAHDGFFVDYTTAVATMDTTKQADAVNNLTTVYLPQFSSFISGATGLPLAAVTDLTKMHITTTKLVVDTQAAGTYPDAATDDLAAWHHMQMIGDPVAAAIVAKLPAKFQ
jgi:hypothetical protein